jgi:ankyrin repeat protein
MGLMEYGAKLNITDSDGRDPLMYAIMNNNEKVVKMLLDNYKGASQVI